MTLSTKTDKSLKISVQADADGTNAKVAERDVIRDRPLSGHREQQRNDVTLLRRLRKGNNQIKHPFNYHFMPSVCVCTCCGEWYEGASIYDIRKLTPLLVHKTYALCLKILVDPLHPPSVRSSYMGIPPGMKGPFDTQEVG